MSLSLLPSFSALWRWPRGGSYQCEPKDAKRNETVEKALEVPIQPEEGECWDFGTRIKVKVAVCPYPWKQEGKYLCWRFAL